MEKSASAQSATPTGVEEGEQPKDKQSKSEQSAITAELQLLKKLLHGIRSPVRDSECMCVCDFDRNKTDVFHRSRYI